MRKLFKKWGEAMLAALCVLAIVFAALYTRQDDLRRMAARSAGSSRDQTLDDAQAAGCGGFRPGCAFPPLSGSAYAPCTRAL